MKPSVEKISLWQLLILIIIFEIGSAAIVGIGNEAKQDAWIAIMATTIFGASLVAGYVFLLSKLPGKHLFELLSFCFGKWIGGLISYLYILYFFYISARVIRDFCELMASTIFANTPIEFLSITMMLIIIYMLYQGLEVLGRTSEIFFPYVFFFVLIIGISVYLSGEIKFTNLQPILAEGIRPIRQAIFPELLTFPFGEMVAFMMIIPYVTKFEKAMKVSIVAILITGVLLTYSSMVQILSLGHEMKERSNFPLLSAAREISLLNFIERVDLLVVFIVMFGIIVKVSIFFYGGVKGLEYLFHRPYRSFLFPIGMLIALFTILISENYAEHIQEGLEFVTKFLHIPFQLTIPFVMLPILWFKTRKKKGGGGIEKMESTL
ncbi:spore germination protein [Cytobacillus spongiae]|uniref:GerAB/ArcD/ProY family transporter n=1 Tax=Cytobacillus spongiae TaxID=2901381 RepID=UPI001F39AEAB|nr:endospore germination permease [Cytobacillus spongiae]UII56468.1 spore germination protein [Cytobacillus spongiae]